MANPTYELSTTLTSKPMGASEDDYRIFHEKTESFDSLEVVKRELSERYGTCKRKKIYVGEGTHVGWIYCFKMKDYEGKWFQQDWVTVSEVTHNIVIV